MEYLFKPRSVAVIGASRDKEKKGYIILNNIVSGGYKGRVYPVNPRGGELLGLKVYADIASIEDEIDVAVIVIPADYVPEAVKQCADKKVKYGVVITSGFSEIGRTKEEKEIIDYANSKGMRILGPNSLGYYSATGSLNMTFGLPKVSPGKIAVISQSGGFGIALLGKKVGDELKLSTFFSIGNKADVEESDILEYLAQEPGTKAVLIYMEGVKNGERLVKSLKKITKEKPVIIIKTGSSIKGSQAAASHTGALACSDEVFSALMRQCNVLRTESVSEALDWAYFFTNEPLPQGENVVVFSDGGGMGVMVADALEKRNVRLYDCQSDMEKTFSPLIARFGSYKNPVDITAEHNHETYDAVIKAAIDNENIHAIMVFHCHIPYCDLNKLCEVIYERFLESKAVSKPLAFSIYGNYEVLNAIDYLKERNVPVFDDLIRAVSCFASLFQYSRSMLSVDCSEKEVSLLPAGASKRVCDIAGRAVKDKRDFMLAGETREILDAAGIEIPEGGIAFDAEDSVRIAGETGYPVVMKIVSPDILHKSDAGGVVLNIQGPEEVKKSFDIIRANCLRHNPGMRFHGIEVSRMLEPGVEVIIGARRDASFGPIVMCGLGGIYVEVLKDVAFRAFPLSRDEIKRMLKELKAYPLLEGARGGKPADIESLVDTVLKAGEILAGNPLITDLELNPVFVYPGGIKAVDARIMIQG